MTTAHDGAVTTAPPDGQSAVEELPDAPRSTLRRRLGWGLLVAALVAGVAVRAGTANHAAPKRSTTGQVAQATPLDRVAALAAADSLTDFTRETSPAGACRTVPVGHDVDAAAMTVVRSLLPGARVLDTARTLDQFTGLCALELRASGVGGTVVTVMVSAPPGQPGLALGRVTTGSRARGAVTTRYAMNTAADGWVVLVGAVGDARLEPSLAALASAARNDTLRW